MSSPGLEYNNVDNWNQQFVGVLSIDLDLISELVQQKARLPGIATLGIVNIPEGTTIPSSQTALAVLSSSTPAFVTPREARAKRLFATLSIRGAVGTAGGLMTVKVREFKQTASLSRNFGTLTFNGTSTSIASTPWMPLSLQSSYGYDMFVDLLAQMSGTTSTGTVSAASLRIGVLDGPVFY